MKSTLVLALSAFLSSNAVVLTSTMVNQAKTLNYSGTLTLFFAGMGITDIDAGAFDSYPNVDQIEALYLMGNSIKSFPQNAFQSFSALKYLYAASNQISSLDSGFDCQALELL
jgi:hypothetical protein